MHQAHLIVSGLVQGVYYRATCKEIAIELDLKGWVRNMPTGEVEILIQGEKEKIEKLIEWCKKGSFHAKVSNVKIKWQDINENMYNFKIK